MVEGDGVVEVGSVICCPKYVTQFVLNIFNHFIHSSMYCTELSPRGIAFSLSHPASIKMEMR